MAGLSQFIGKPMVCFISEQPMPNMIAIKLLKPSRLIIIHTDEEKLKRYVQILEVYAKRIVPSAKVAVDVTKPYSVQDTYATVARWIRELGKSVTVNVTGGTKIMSIGAYRAAIDSGAVPVYVDPKGDRLVNLNDEADALPAPSMSVAEILFGHGAEIKEEKTHKFLSNPATGEMGKYLVKEAANWNVLNNEYFHKQLEKDKPEYRITPKPHECGPFARILREFKNTGFLSTVKIDNGRLVFSVPDDAARNWLWDKGVWLEAYVFSVIRELGFQEVRAGVKLVWSQSGSTPPTNELDMLVSVGTRLTGISCKFSGKTDINYLNELDVYLKRFGGIFANKILVIAKPRDEIGGEFLTRAREMGIKVLALDDLQAEDFPSRMRNAVTGQGGTV